MNFTLQKTQEMLQKSAKDFLEKECKELARESESTDEGYSAEIWKKMARLGWMGVGIPEQYGGMEGDLFEAVLLLHQMGRVLLPGPFISTAVLSGQLILQYGSDEQKSTILQGITDGKLVVVPAIVDPDPNVGKADISEQVEVTGDGYKISGTKLFVPYGHTADWFIYAAPCFEDGPTLFLVDAKSSGIQCNALESLANDKPCEVIFDQVQVPAANVLGKIGEGNIMLDKLNQLGALSHSAYLTGLLEKILDMASNYAKERVQFEKPIGSFQAIQHQCANMFIDVEQVKFMTYNAGFKLSRDLPAVKEISIAKARASDAARRVSLLGVKIHGGIGIIDEYDNQLYFRRAKMHQQAFGDADFHRDIVSREVGLLS